MKIFLQSLVLLAAGVPGAAPASPPAPPAAAIPAASLARAAPLPAAAAPASSVPGGKIALELEAGSVAHHQLVAMGRDIVVAGDALADVAALQGSVIVTGHVGGDVIVLGGNARLGPRARVDGDISVVGGTIQADLGARIGGRSVSYPNASPSLVALLEGPSLGLAAFSPVVVGAKLALLAAWAALLLFFFAASGRQLLETAADVRREPFRSFITGLTGVVTLCLTALAFSVFLGGLAWAPLLALVMLLGLALKLWGMVAVFYAFGDWIMRRVARRHLRPLNAATVGLLLLGVLKFLPYVGVWSWTAASLVGVGATLSTKFGRRELWFNLA
ncbi:MAG TPA: hypothetical protein VHR45_06115 [Thermoanaerobaculia bacterium]|nr:hypothetical protein [Thermoanaerobaculia bacterium]